MSLAGSWGPGTLFSCFAVGGFIGTKYSFSPQGVVVANLTSGRSSSPRRSRGSRPRRERMLRFRSALVCDRRSTAMMSINRCRPGVAALAVVNLLWPPSRITALTPIASVIPTMIARAKPPAIVLARG
jgi:hypothetical protein